MNNLSVTSVLGLLAIVGIIFLLQYFMDSMFGKKKTASTPQNQPAEPEIAAQDQSTERPRKIAWVKITLLLLCIAMYAALEYENGALVIAASADLPSSSPLFFLVGNITNVVSYARLLFWVLITVLFLSIFNNIVTLLFASPRNRNARGTWRRHLAAKGRPLIAEDFSVQTKAVEAFVKDGDKDALLKFLNAHGVAPEWFVAYQKRIVPMWILVASATLLLSLIFFLWPAHDTYLAGLDNVLGNVAIPNLNAYQTEMLFAAVFLLLAGFAVGTLCWRYIVNPVERFTGRRSRHRLIMEHSDTNSI